MKWLSSALSLLLVLTLVGCHRGTPGGPGTTQTVETKRDKNTGETTETVRTEKTTDSSKTFTLDPPNLSTKLKQGESRQLVIGVKRGSNFDQAVALSFDSVPAGVAIEPAKTNVARGDKEAKFNVRAADIAVPDSYTIKVIGHPATGPDAMNEFKITVEKK